MAVAYDADRRAVRFRFEPTEVEVTDDALASLLGTDRLEHAVLDSVVGRIRGQLRDDIARLAAGELYDRRTMTGPPVSASERLPGTRRLVEDVYRRPIQYRPPLPSFRDFVPPGTPIPSAHTDSPECRCSECWDG
jgi:hypothetical protein